METKAIKRLSLVAVSVALAVGVVACDGGGRSTINSKYGELHSGIDRDNMDTSVRPQDDFFRYINGQWLERTEIPADRARWGSFDELRERAEQQVLAIVQEFAEQVDAEQGSDEQKIGDLYRAFMDVDAIESAGLTPIAEDIERIDNLQIHADLAKYWGLQQRYRMGTPVVLFVGQDQRQSDQYITSISQSGLGLPDRDYYLNDGESSEQIRQQYRDFIIALWQAAEWADAEQAAETIIAIETRLAEAQWSRVENRDRQATYNKLTVDDVRASAPGFDWRAMIDAAEFDIEELIVRQPSYLSEFAEIQGSVDIDDWKFYLKFHTLRQSADWLSSKFSDINFDFYGRTLQGLEAQREREKRAVATVENALGFMVGQAYVERHYQQDSQARMEELIANLKIAFEQAINDLEWMSAETKQEAQAKLATFTTKIGYPQEWRDYDCLTISADDLVGNMRRSANCEYQRMLGRLGSEVDRHDWGMTPQTVNAYYRSTMNEIVFPAAILQPPFFNVDAEDAVNYGAIGGVIGHEITHGFDDQGRRSDGEGNLRDWWSATDEEQFRERAQLMIDQYSSFTPIDDMQLNGALGLGENIADLGGLTVSYRAYMNSLDGSEAPVMDGMTGEQRFFAGWAQIWRIKFRDEALRRQIITGPHSPGEYRVRGVLSNMPEFYQAFEVSPDDGMYRDEDVRVKIW